MIKKGKEELERKRETKIIKKQKCLSERERQV